MGLIAYDKAYVKDLSTPLVSVSPYRQDDITADDFTKGIHFWASIGGGKTTSAEVVEAAYFRAGMGGLITATKPDEISLQESRARKHGRGDSLVLVEGVNETFNFLDYLLATQGMDGIGTVTEALMHVIDAARKSSPDASRGGGESSFWADATRETLRYTIPPLYRADGTVSIPGIIRFVSTAPKSRAEVTSREWKERSFMYNKLVKSVPKVRMDERSLANAVAFWSERWAGMDERTRSNVMSTITATLDRFNHGRLHRMFCGATTVVPELSYGGAVQLLACPTTLWGEDATIAQQLYKFIWEKQVLSRNALELRQRERFIFLWSDEAQDLVNAYDYEFLSLCRSSRCCVCFLTQSLPTYTAKMGGGNAKDAAMALAGKFVTHIFGSNSCPETNEFAAKMLGRVKTRRETYSEGSSRNVNWGMSAGSNENSGSSSSYGTGSGVNGSYGSSSGAGSNWGDSRGRGTSRNQSRGFTESMEYQVEPGDFARMLRTGGTRNGREVTAVWFQAGRVFEASGGNWLIAKFRQE